MIYLLAIVIVVIVIALSIKGGIEQGKMDIANRDNLQRLADNSETANPKS